MLSNIEITDLNFEEKINSKPRTIVAFMAEGCYYSQKMLPEFLKARLESGIEVPFFIAEHKSVLNSMKKYKIIAFPTICLFEAGERKNIFLGDRTSEHLISFSTGRRT